LVRSPSPRPATYSSGPESRAAGRRTCPLDYIGGALFGVDRAADRLRWSYAEGRDSPVTFTCSRDVPIHDLRVLEAHPLARDKAEWNRLVEQDVA